VYARNKRYITLNLKSPEGVGLFRQLLPRFDVVMESFVPGRSSVSGSDGTCSRRATRN
jgi:crotonobetainyl-CoA:carnitine CoA-transferase CaiB-like acyl-CoA transferase